MKYLILFLFIITNNQISIGQKLSIENVELENVGLIEVISNFITNQEKQSNKFATQGYLELRLISFNNYPNKNNLKESYTLVDQYYSYNKESNNIPRYYTYLKNRLILIYTFEDLLKLEFTDKSKRALFKKINKSLGKKEKLKIYDKKGKLIINDKNFYPDESFNIHGGITIDISNNGAIKTSKNSNF